MPPSRHAARCTAVCGRASRGARRCRAAAAAAANDPLRPDQPNLSLIESDAARATSSGKGAIVAIIDTGVKASHPDLQGGRLLPGYDFVDNDGTPQDDVDGHGTHVLGIVGATENNGVGVSSVAPGARLLPVRVLDNTGAGFVEDVAKGIDYAVAQGAHVINLSLGSDVPLLGAIGGDEYDDAIRRALAAGPGGGGFLGQQRRARLRAAVCGPGPAVRGRGERQRRHAPPSRASAPGLGDHGARAATCSRPSPTAATPASRAPRRRHRTWPEWRRCWWARGCAARRWSTGCSATARDAGSPGPDAFYGAGIVNARQAVAGFPPDGVAGRRPRGRRQARPRASSCARRDRIRSDPAPRDPRALPRRRARGAAGCSASRKGRRLAAGSKKRHDRPQRGRRGQAEPPRPRRCCARRCAGTKRITLRVRVTLPGSRALVRRLKLRPVAGPLDTGDKSPPKSSTRV